VGDGAGQAARGNPVILAKWHFIPERELILMLRSKVNRMSQNCYIAPHFPPPIPWGGRLITFLRKLRRRRRRRKKSLSSEMRGFKSFIWSCSRKSIILYQIRKLSHHDALAEFSPILQASLVPAASGAKTIRRKFEFRALSARLHLSCHDIHRARFLLCAIEKRYPKYSRIGTEQDFYHKTCCNYLFLVLRTILAVADPNFWVFLRPPKFSPWASEELGCRVDKLENI
jgi:hypothetical protein